MVYLNIVKYNILLFIFILILKRLFYNIKTIKMFQVKIGLALLMIIYISSYIKLYYNIYKDNNIDFNKRRIFILLSALFIIFFIIAKVLLLKFVDKNKKYSDDKKINKKINKTKIHQIFNISYLFLFIILNFIFARTKEIYDIVNSVNGLIYLTILFIFIYINFFNFLNKRYTNDNTKKVIIPVLLNSVIYIYLITILFRYLRLNNLINFDKHFSYIVVIIFLTIFFMFVMLYNFLSNMSNTIKTSNGIQKNKTMATIFNIFMIISIFIMLWIKDSLVWSRYENLYIIILLLFIICYVMNGTYQNYFNSFMFFVFIIIFIKLLIGKWTNVKNSLGNLFVNYKGNIKEII